MLPILLPAVIASEPLVRVPTRLTSRIACSPRKGRTSGLVPGREGDKTVLATVFLKGRDEGLPIPAATVEDLNADAKIPVRLPDEKAESVLIVPLRISTAWGDRLTTPPPTQAG